MKQKSTQLPGIFVAALLLLVSLLVMSCGVGDAFGPKETPTATITFTPVPSATPKPTATATPLPGIGAPLPIGNVDILFFQAAYQDRYELDVQGIKEELENEVPLDLINATMKINGQFNQPDGPGGSSFMPMQDTETFMIVEAIAYSGGCEEIFGWEIGLADLGESVPLTNVIATCWEFEDAESQNKEYHIFWGLVVPKETAPVLILPGGQTIDLTPVME